MSKKQLNTQAMLSELSGSSVFFPASQANAIPTPPEPDADKTSRTKPAISQAAVMASNRDTVVSRYHDTNLEDIRKAVRQFGKEAATHRFTIEEKQQLAQLIFSYARKGIRTNENEITRIAINLLFADHTANGKDSILDKALHLLNR